VERGFTVISLTPEKAAKMWEGISPDIKILVEWILEKRAEGG